VLVFSERTGRQVVVAFVARPRSAAEHRVALDLLVVPDAWRDALSDRPQRTGIDK
jgi:hypothetical protein